MIFANVNAGHYIILEADVVIATVKRRYEKLGYKEWSQAIYEVVWKDPSLPMESFKRISDIQKFYPFENYGGYNSVLVENVKSTNRPSKRRIPERVMRPRSIYVD